MNKKLILSMLISLSITNTAYAEVYQGEVDRSWFINGQTYTCKNVKGLIDSQGRTGWVTEGNKWYYLNKGIARNHPLTQHKTTYYFKSDGEWLEPNTKEYNKYKALLEQLDFAVKHKLKDFKLQVEGYNIIDYANLVDSYMSMYINNYCADPSLLGINFNNEGIKYEYDNKQDLVMTNLDNINSLVNTIVAEAESKSSDSEKVRYINLKMLELFDYDYTLQNKGSDLVSAALNQNKILCFGYACIFETLCTKVGLNADVIVGRTPYGTHSWNSVQVDGETKYVDVCWNETAKTNETYLLMSSDEISKDHFEDNTLKIAFLDKK